MIMSTSAFMIMVVMMMFMLFVIVVMSASTLFVMVVMMMFMFFVIVVMSASTFFIMVVMMMFVFFVIMVMMMLMFFMIVVMMVMFSVFMHMSAFRANFLFCQKFICQRYRIFHNLKKFLSFQFLNRCCDDRCFGVDLTKQFQSCLCFCFINDIGTAHDDRSGIFNLVVKELTKVSHIHFAFLCINNSCVAVQYQAGFFLYTLYCFDDI